METVESPLDVLSRAATMVQDGASNIVSDESKQASTKQLPTTKWKRERRRLPEYSRKSDPKLADNLPPELQSPSSPTESSAPLDMSVRQRGQPPSYTQAISSPSYRPSVITQAPIPNPATGAHNLPSGISMCDPIIDEHFRRSLGKDYVMLFNKQVVPEPPPVVDSAGLSVDDHFAKALGDTWLKLNQKESEPNAGGDKPAVVSL